jgi:hypothetical protein
MAFCTDSNWTIRMYKDDPELRLPPTWLDDLFFELHIDNGKITGDVYINSVRISGVEGTCEDDAALNASTMRLKFTWSAVQILMAGVAHVEGAFNRFKGRFFAFPPETQPSLEIKRLALVPPDEGDTGTANGSQT